MATQPGAIQCLVDLDRGVISREIFVNEAIYQQEQERIFARVWLFVGHESQVPKPGDYFQSYMGEESVILTRDSQHKLHVFLNTCRHRGTKLLGLCVDLIPSSVRRIEKAETVPLGLSARMPTCGFDLTLQPFAHVILEEPPVDVTAVSIVS